jgi:A/G-specific adenine glycosylase
MRVKRSSPDASLLRAAEKILPRGRADLIKWFSRNARALPWRKPMLRKDAAGFGGKNLRRNPYAEWVAEMMLQQTQVITVIPYFEKWMKRFPDVKSLANAGEADFMRHWAGLGYYSRVRNLHRGAQMVLKQGHYPVALEEWKALPGIGEYTAGAIASLAFDFSEAIVDGNVVRVFSRFFGLDFLPVSGRDSREAYWQLAKIWTKGNMPGDANEGLMELGALVCKPAAPLCNVCPLSTQCMARKHGWQNTLPPIKPRQRVESITGTVLVLENSGRVFLEKRPQGSFLAGHFLFPFLLDSEKSDWKIFLDRCFSEWKWVDDPYECGVIRHSIMNRRYVFRVLRLGIKRGSSKRKMELGNSEAEWTSLYKLEETLTNSLARKIWRLVKA